MEKGRLIRPNESILLKVAEDRANLRLDVFLSLELTRYSRSFLKNLIEDDYVKINGQIINKPSAKVKNSDSIIVTFPKYQIPKPQNAEHINVDVKVLFKNTDFLIVYKPANLLVHSPSNKSSTPTLVDWLAYNFTNIVDVGLADRPGIVHRLDKDTSGLIIVPINNYSHAIFSRMFKNRDIKKRYLAVVKGHPDKKGIINFNIERSREHNNKMTYSIETGRNAETHYKVLEYYKDCSLLEVRIITGRTHQIRVHLSAIGYPIIGDSLYGVRSKFINRQALHAYSLDFEFKGINFSFKKEMPADIENLLEKAKNNLLTII